MSVRVPGGYNPASVAITGGSIAGVTGVAVKQATVAIPFIQASSGSMANNGVLTGLAALGTTYADCYLYLPLNAINTGSAAGWYYAQMSSTTAGTVFNNTYTTGIPTIPTSPTAFATTGPGAFTGDATEQGLTLPIPANALGATGMIRVTHGFAYTNSAGTKTLRVRYSGSSGTQFESIAVTTTASFPNLVHIFNRGKTNAQVGIATAGSGFGTLSAGVPVYSSVDTTAATTVFVSVTKVAADNAIIEGVMVETIS